MKHAVVSAKKTTSAGSLWPAFGLGLAVAVGNGLARFAYALLLPAMRDDLHWSYAQAGWLNTANALGYIVGAVTGYFLLRRVSPAHLFSCGLWLAFLALLVTGLGSSLIWLTTTRLVSGIGAAWVFSCGGALIAARYPATDRHRGTATGLFFAGAGLGIALSGLMINPLLASLGPTGWSSAWLLLGLLAILLSIWPLKEVRRDCSISSSSPGWALSLQGMWMSLLGYFAFAAGYIVYMTFILAWIRIEGWSWHLGTLVWLTLGVSVVVSPFIWRHALAHWPAALTLSVSCLATSLGTAIPLFDANARGLLISAALFGLGVFIAPSAIAVLVRQKLPVAQMAKGMMLFTVVFSIGQAIGPVAAGWIADAYTLNQSLLFGLALLLAGALLSLLGLDREVILKRKQPLGKGKYD